MSQTHPTKLWWKCLNCGETVNFTAELLDVLFDKDTGEALFDTTEEAEYSSIPFSVLIVEQPGP